MHLLRAILLLAACLVATALSQSPSQKLPHVLFVLVDDVGYADMGYTGGVIPTPFMDQLSGEGRRLTNYYTHPVCTPTRTALMTGRYSAASGIQNPFLIGDDGLPLSLSLEEGGDGLLPEMLRQQFGFRNFMAGKWHLGHSTWNHMPTRRGFDGFYGFLTAAVSHDTKLLWTPRLTGRDLWQQEMPVMNTTHSSALYTEKLFDMARAELEEQALAGQEHPLFLYLALGAAHSPLQATESQMARCSSIHTEMRRKYCGLVVSIDDAVAQAHAYLEDLGMLNDTIIIFSSDNGGQPWEGARNYPFRGAKHTPFEGGSHVPGFVWMPPRIRRYEGGEDFAPLMHVSDWKPTLEGLMRTLRESSDGKEEPVEGSMAEEGSLANARVSGYDQSAILTGSVKETAFTTRPDVLMHYSNGRSLYGSATVGYRYLNWKLVVDQHGGGSLTRHFEEPLSWWDWIAPNASFADKVMELSLIGATWVYPADELFIRNEIINRFSDVLARAHVSMLGLWPSSMNQSSEGPDTRLSRRLPVLYDLSVDPGETMDVSQSHPEVIKLMLARLGEVEGEIRQSYQHIMHTERNVNIASQVQHSLKLLHDDQTGLDFHGPWTLPATELPAGLSYRVPSSSFTPPAVAAQYFILGEGLFLAVLVTLVAIVCGGCLCRCCWGSTSRLANESKGNAKAKRE